MCIYIHIYIHVQIYVSSTFTYIYIYIHVYTHTPHLFIMGPESCHDGSRFCMMDHVVGKVSALASQIPETQTQAKLLHGKRLVVSGFAPGREARRCSLPSIPHCCSLGKLAGNLGAPRRKVRKGKRDESQCRADAADVCVCVCVFLFFVLFLFFFWGGWRRGGAGVAPCAMLLSRTPRINSQIA